MRRTGAADRPTRATPRRLQHKPLSAAIRVSVPQLDRIKNKDDDNDDRRRYFGSVRRSPYGWLSVLRDLDPRDYADFSDTTTGMNGAKAARVLRRLVRSRPEDLQQREPTVEELTALYALTAHDPAGFLSAVASLFGGVPKVPALPRGSAGEDYPESSLDDSADRSTTAKGRAFRAALREALNGQLGAINVRKVRSGGRGERVLEAVHSDPGNTKTANEWLEYLVQQLDPEALQGKRVRLRNVKNRQTRGVYGDDRIVGNGDQLDHEVHLYSGNDQLISNGGKWRRAIADLGDGDDIVQLQDVSVRRMNARLGRGDDVYGAFGNLEHIRVDGGGGDDIVDISGRVDDGRFELNNGDDFARLTGAMTDVEIIGGDGHDVVALDSRFLGARYKNVRVDLGDDNDTIVLDGQHDATEVALGEGNDQAIIGESFRGSVTITDPDEKSRVKHTGARLREHDQLVLTGDGWEQVDDRHYVRRDDDGEVLARVKLGNKDGKNSRVEVVSTNPRTGEPEVLRDIKPDIEKPGGLTGFFQSKIGQYIGIALSIASAVVTGGASLALMLASGIYNGFRGLTSGTTLGIISGIASIAGSFASYARALQSGPLTKAADALETAKTTGSQAAIDAAQVTFNGIKGTYDALGIVTTGARLVGTGASIYGKLKNFSASNGLSIISDVLGLAGRGVSSLATSLGSSVLRFIENGAVTIEDLLTAAVDGFKLGRAIDTKNAARRTVRELEDQFRGGYGDRIVRERRRLYLLGPNGEREMLARVTRSNQTRYTPLGRILLDEIFLDEQQQTDPSGQKGNVKGASTGGGKGLQSDPFLLERSDFELSDASEEVREALVSLGYNPDETRARMYSWTHDSRFGEDIEMVAVRVQGTIHYFQRQPGPLGTKPYLQRQASLRFDDLGHRVEIDLSTSAGIDDYRFLEGGLFVPPTFTRYYRDEVTTTDHAPLIRQFLANQDRSVVTDGMLVLNRQRHGRFLVSIEDDLGHLRAGWLIDGSKPYEPLVEVRAGYGGQSRVRVPGDANDTHINDIANDLRTRVDNENVATGLPRAPQVVDRSDLPDSVRRTVDNFDDDVTVYQIPGASNLQGGRDMYLVGYGGTPGQPEGYAVVDQTGPISAYVSFRNGQAHVELTRYNPGAASVPVLTGRDSNGTPEVVHYHRRTLAAVGRQVTLDLDDDQPGVATVSADGTPVAIVAASNGPVAARIEYEPDGSARIRPGTISPDLDEGEFDGVLRAIADTNPVNASDVARSIYASAVAYVEPFGVFRIALHLKRGEFREALLETIFAAFDAPDALRALNRLLSARVAATIIENLDNMLRSNVPLQKLVRALNRVSGDETALRRIIDDPSTVDDVIKSTATSSRHARALAPTASTTRELNGTTYRHPRTKARAHPRSSPMRFCTKRFRLEAMAKMSSSISGG